MRERLQPALALFVRTPRKTTLLANRGQALSCEPLDPDQPSKD